MVVSGGILSCCGGPPTTGKLKCAMVTSSIAAFLYFIFMILCIVGVAGIGTGGNLGTLGGKTLLFYATTTLAAILVGLFLINLVGPGYVEGQPAKDLLALNAPVDEIAARVEGRGGT